MSLGTTKQADVGEIESLREEITSLKQEVSSLMQFKARFENEFPGDNLLSGSNEENDSTSGALASSRARLASASEEAIRNTSLKLSGDHLDDPFIGNKDARLLVMVFIDFEGPSSGRFFRTSFVKLKELIQDNKDIKLIIRDFPLEHHKNAREAATWANCAGEQGHYWQVFDAFFQDPESVSLGKWEFVEKRFTSLDTDRMRRCIKSRRYDKEIDADLSEGIKAGVSGSPSFLIGQGPEKSDIFSAVLVRGAQPYPVLKTQILEQLARTSQ